MSRVEWMRMDMVHHVPLANQQPKIASCQGKKAGDGYGPSRPLAKHQPEVASFQGRMVGDGYGPSRSPR